MKAVTLRPDLVRAPARVADVDLSRPGEFRRPGGRELFLPEGQVWALVRLHGLPVGMVSAADGSGPDGLWRSVVNAAQGELASQVARHLAADEARAPDAGRPTPPCQLPRLHALREAPAISVIVASRDRPELLRRCLCSLLRSDYPDFEVIVVDNAPADDATESLVRRAFRGRVRYVREPVAGLARAHNTGLARARGSLVAFTDDDTLVDPGWLSALATAFVRDPQIGCVTGLILPTELETATQVVLECLGDYAKGYTPCTWSLSEPPDEPLFPFTAGRFGSGANMAFRTDVIRSLGGFDPATGAGTPARSGDDLLSFFEVLHAGHKLAYQPDAIVWHRHRRTPDAVAAQVFGYGVGFGAYLTGALARDPRRLYALLRRLPGGIRFVMSRSRARSNDPVAGWSRNLTLLELRGMAYGPYGYLRGRLTSGRA
ncbi:glycosyltransferase [Streptomyces cavernae]|uniref:glycosyltransferase n=1 Tax=Streptomyces cavernae TaxID=2259034 RepID=UPI001EE4C62B|nr:glycosyltransferase [Streptomyces cavernae]